MGVMQDAMEQPDFLSTYSIDIVPLDRTVFESRQQKLQNALYNRFSPRVLWKRGILVLSGADLAQMEQNEYVDHIYHKRKESLTESLSKRRDLSAIADLGYIDDSGMAPRLQPTALRLNRRLTERKTKEELVMQGIIQNLHNEEDEEQMAKVEEP